MTKRLATDAKIVLERAGYTVYSHANRLAIFSKESEPESLTITSGTVNNDRVCELLKAKGFSEWGHPLPKAEPHISEQVAAVLLSDGWRTNAESDRFTKVIHSFAPAGTISNGSRVVMPTICPVRRYLARVDGWGKVETDVDLRDYANRPADAIAAVLKG